MERVGAVGYGVGRVGARSLATFSVLRGRGRWSGFEPGLVAWGLVAGGVLRVSVLAAGVGLETGLGWVTGRDIAHWSIVVSDHPATDIRHRN